jgi:hypothetical protein
MKAVFGKHLNRRSDNPVADRLLVLGADAGHGTSGKTNGRSP